MLHDDGDDDDDDNDDDDKAERKNVFFCHNFEIFVIYRMKWGHMSLAGVTLHEQYVIVWTYFWSSFTIKH